MEIVKAELEQAVEIALLNDAVQKLHAEHHPEIFKYPTDTSGIEQFFRDRISDKDHTIFIARILKQAVGYVWFAVERRPKNVFKYAQARVYIHQLSVNPDYRRSGVGNQLMMVVEGVAREHNICKFALDSWAFNKEAHAFFEQQGFSCFNINMWKEMTAR
jgi:ribosomal protein S18 acetylase RimI-like enzyme